MLTTILLTGFVILLAYWIYDGTRKPKNFPPGPPRLPLIGSLLSIGIPPHKGLARLGRKYGKIIGLFSGNYPSIVLNELSLIKDAFGDERFSARPPLRPFLERSLDGSMGIIFGTGEKWLEQRKFIVKVFRDFGFGKRDTHEIVLEEMMALTNQLKKTEGQPVIIAHHCHTAIINALWTIVAGKRFSYEEPELQKIIGLTAGVLRFRSLDSANIIPQLLFFQPFLTKFFPGLTGWNEFMKSFELVFPVFRKYIESHKESYDENNIRDLIDVYLQKIKSVDNKDSPFYKENGERALLVTLLDLFVAGGETASSNLAWGLLHLTHHKDFQKRLHEEIDTIIGTNRLPCIEDKQKMPLMEACINETLRMATIGVLSIFHSTTVEIPDFHGYTLPKDTIVYGNFWQVNHDKEVWGDPESFRPERFLGAGSSKLSRINVFSRGKRICPGEGLARDELFLFMTGALQQFSFKMAPNSPAPCFDPVLAATIRMDAYKVIVEQRIHN